MHHMTNDLRAGLGVVSVMALLTASAAAIWACRSSSAGGTLLFLLILHRLKTRMPMPARPNTNASARHVVAGFCECFTSCSCGRPEMIRRPFLQIQRFIDICWKGQLCAATWQVWKPWRSAIHWSVLALPESCLLVADQGGATEFRHASFFTLQDDSSQAWTCSPTVIISKGN